MVKRFIVLVLAALLALSCESGTSRSEQPLADCELITVPTPDLSAIEENGTALLALYRAAADATDVEQKAALLRQAAGVTIRPAVRGYLLNLSEDLLAGDDARSQRAWLALSGSQMDLLVTGPVTRVVLHNPERTAQLRRVAARLPEFQAALPADEDLLAFLPESTDLISCDVLYSGGGQTLTRESLGNRVILFDNLIREQYNRSVFPAGLLLLQPGQQVNLDASAFYWNAVFQELARDLGVQETLDGRPVDDALGEEAFTLESAKADALGTLLCLQEVQARRVNAFITPESVLATFATDLIRQTRLGAEDPSGKASLLIYNFLTQQKALVRSAAGLYTIDEGKAPGALEALGGQILRLQANGRPDAAAAFVKQYAQLPKTLRADIGKLEKNGIPADIRLCNDIDNTVQ